MEQNDLMSINSQMKMSLPLEFDSNKFLNNNNIVENSEDINEIEENTFALSKNTTEN